LVSGQTGYDFTINIIAVKKNEGVEWFLGIAKIVVAHPKKPKN
jgi:hypothetical protein